jgi:hypothetical protein
VGFVVKSNLLHFVALFRHEWSFTTNYLFVNNFLYKVLKS